MTRRWLIFVACLTVLYAGYTSWRVARLENAREASGGSWSQTTSVNDAEAATPKAKAPPRLIAPFTLTDQTGQPFDTSSLRGKVWVASFFFVSCPSICVRLNQALANLQLTEPASEVHFVSITCDPENDTPEMLDRYARHFKADPRRWTFLTGDLAEIQKIGVERFQVGVEKGTHSDRVFAIDRAGYIRGNFRVTEPEQLDKLKALLAKLEAEPVPPEAAASEPISTEAPAGPVQPTTNDNAVTREGAGS
jgi:cytochrome oxidase Cu insertion factor (SCO1/SenC/PrrC family)